MITKEYLAGFIDGEGSIALYKHKDSRTSRGFTIHPQFEITNTNTTILKEINKVVEGRIKTKSKVSPNQKQVYTIMLQDLKSIKKVLLLVKDSLVVKKRQAELMLEFCESRLKSHNKRYSLKEYEIVELFSTINKRGEKRG